MIPSGGATEKNPEWHHRELIGTVRLVAQCLNHYATPGPLQYQNTSIFTVFGAVLVMDHSHVWKYYGILLSCHIQKYQVGCHSWVWHAAMHIVLYYFYFLCSCFVLLYSVCVSSSVYCTHTLLVTCVSVSFFIWACYCMIPLDSVLKVVSYSVNLHHLWCSMALHSF